MNKFIAVIMAVFIMSCTASEPVYAKTIRSRATTYEFEKTHPCPSTGKRYGSCPGYIKDHIVPLCKGGPDSVKNMQWQTYADSKKKDAWECKR